MINPWLWIIGGTFMLQGCAQIPSTSRSTANVLPIISFYASSQCGTLRQPGVIWIADRDSWERQYKQLLDKQLLGGQMTLPPPPAVDFTREGIVLIAMGQQPSGGYGLSLRENTATLENDVVIVPVNWREPFPGQSVTQALTNPCMAVRLPIGAFRRIHVRDQNGQLRLEGGRSQGT